MPLATRKNLNGQYIGEFQLTKQVDSEGASVASDIDAVSYATGTIVSSDGWVATTIGELNGGELRVTMTGGREFPAAVHAIDKRCGSRLIKVDASELDWGKLQTEKASLSESVATVYASNLDKRNVAIGIVSAQDRSVAGVSADLFQTDIAAPDVSGGAPVVGRKNGELLGILVANTNATEGSGASYAVPTLYVRQLLERQKSGTPFSIDRAFLGVQIGRQGKDNEGRSHSTSRRTKRKRRRRRHPSDTKTSGW